MQSNLVRSYGIKILTTVLQPRCALCDEHHRLPDRLCSACKISIASAEREGFAGVLSVGSIGPYQRSGLVNRTFSRCNEQQQQSKNLGALDTVVSAFNYQGAVPDLITRWKYQGMIELTDYIAKLVAELTAKGKLSMPDHDLVTVIPSHWQRDSPRLRSGLAASEFTGQKRCSRQTAIHAQSLEKDALPALKTPR